MINVLFGGNYKVLDGLTLCLMSMVKHTDDALNIFILTADVSELNQDYKPITEINRVLLESIIKEKNPNSTVTLIKLEKDFNKWILSSQNKLSKYTPYTFLRLFADKIDEIPDKIIYLDTDIMLNGDISELFNIDISNYELGVILDRYGKIFIGRRYFNAGVLLINMNEAKQSNLFERTKELCLNKKMAFGDQDALNRCAKKIKFLPRKFNEQGNLRSDTVVQHFTKRFTLFPYFHTINIKPWHIDKVHKVRKNFNYDDIYERFSRLKNR